jgi:hypothetical protein
MDCKTEFLSQLNIDILWDIIYENIIYNKNNISLETLQMLFLNLIKHFKTNEKMQNLIETNKKFITIINNKIKEENDKSKSKPLITFDDIQKDRTSIFEKQLIEKQNDFNNLINKPVPAAPNFKNDIDKPIEEMESLLKKTIEQRNLDIFKINAKTDPLKTEQFLKSKNTSIKSENNELKQITIDYVNTAPNLKKFNVTDLNILDVDKKVTWGDEVKDAAAATATATKEPYPNLKLEQNFFSKLKLFETKSSNEITSRNIDLTSLNDKLDIIMNKLDLIINTHNIHK